MDRRTFLGIALAAPAIVRAESLMPVRSIIVPKSYTGLMATGWNVIHPTEDGANLAAENLMKLVAAMEAAGIRPIWTSPQALDIVERHVATQRRSHEAPHLHSNVRQKLGDERRRRLESIRSVAVQMRRK